MTTNNHFPLVIHAESPLISKTFTRERLEEAAGVIFIAASFFLTGWFYYDLYRTLHDYWVF